MDLEKKEPETKNKKVDSRTEDDLKKKEESGIETLKTNEKKGLSILPIKIKNKIREKMVNGWTTEVPNPSLFEFYDNSEINSIFNDKIKIFRIKPSSDFFNALVRQSDKISIKRGFCRSLSYAKNNFDLTERQKTSVNDIINKCDNNFVNEPIKKMQKN